MIQKIQFQKINDQAVLPNYATSQSAGMDLYSINPTEIELRPGERKLFSLGFAMALPEGYEAQIRSRSGLAMKFGVCVLNSPGTIDSDYRGEIKIILMNLGDHPFIVLPHMKIAQMVIAKYEKVEWDIVQQLNATERGEGGFGSTGL